MGDKTYFVLALIFNYWPLWLIAIVVGGIALIGA